MPRPQLIVVMGPSGSGKSSVGRALAQHLGLPFADADDLHPAANLAKMASGRPLDDDDRWPWLGLVGDALAAASRTGLVMACSALRRAYRDAIRAEAPGTVFVELHGTRELLAERMASRGDHFMPAALLDSQLASLEPLGADETGVRVDVAPAIVEIVSTAARSLVR
jgi:carbohydrate kinase (thermoresistant glucokinase family)